MPFENDVVKAWRVDDQDRLMGLLLFDYDFNNPKVWRQAATDFLKASATPEIGNGVLRLLQLCNQIYGKLGPNKKKIWSDFVVPHLLNFDSSKSMDEIQWAIAAAGGELPSQEWDEATVFIAEWVKFRITQYSSDANLRDDNDKMGFYGFGSEDPVTQVYRPALFHPMVLRILRSTLQPGDPYTKDLVRWLAKSVFSNPSTPATVNTVFSAGSLILFFAREGNHVTVTVDKIDGSNEWQAWVTNVIDVVVNCSEPGVEERLNDCPDWRSTPLIGHLRKRARERLVEQVDAIASPNIVLSVEDFSLDFENYGHAQLPLLRPNSPLTGVDGQGKWRGADFGTEWEEYRSALTNIVDADKKTAESNRKVETVARQVSELHEAFRKHLETQPLARLALPEVLSEKPGNPVVEILLQQQLRSMNLYAVTQDGSDFRAGSLHTQPQWIETVSKSGGDTIAQLTEGWTRLEPWDQIRGRFAEAMPGANDWDWRARIAIWNDLPVWLKSEAEIPSLAIVTDPDPEEFNKFLDGLRPKLAALVHLGLPMNQDSAPNYFQVSTNLKQLLDKDLSPSLKTTVKAARLELGITAIAAGSTIPQAFPEFQEGSELDLVGSLLSWTQDTLDSENVWESRSGMSILILLARLSESAGDLFLSNLLNRAEVWDTTIAKDVIQSAIRQLIGEPVAQDRRCKSSLPLAYVAFDLMRYAREAALGIVPGEYIAEPPWSDRPIFELIRSLQKTIVDEPKRFEQFPISGYLAAWQLAATLWQIRLGTYEQDRRLSIKPASRNEVEFLAKMCQGVRSIICAHQISARGLVAPEIGRSWRQLRTWALYATDGDTSVFVPVTGQAQALVTGDNRNALDSGRLPAELSNKFVVLSTQGDEEPLVRIDVVAKWNEAVGGVRWLIVANNKRYSLHFDPQEPTPPFSLEETLVPFQLATWAVAFRNRPEIALLQVAATLEAATPPLTPAMPSGTQTLFHDRRLLVDIDGYLDGEFPNRSYKTISDDFDSAIERLQEIENDYISALEDYQEKDQTDQLVKLLKQPLYLSTADYREQLQAALYDVRQAEAELQVAEHNALAADFERTASDLIYESMKVEIERHKAFEEIQKFQSRINVLTEEINIKEKKLADGAANRAELQMEIAGFRYEQAKLSTQKAQEAATAIQTEIEAVRKLLGDLSGEPYSKDQNEVAEAYRREVEIEDANGAKAIWYCNGIINTMAVQIRFRIASQLENDLTEARNALQTAQDKQREQEKKAKRRAWVDKVCKFVGQAVGAYFGNPALGAAIGSAMGEVINGVMDNQPPEAILVGLIDDAFTISAAAGYDLETELNSLGAKTAEKLNGFFEELDFALKPILEEMPTILNDEMFNQALQVLDLQEIPGLANLVGASYAGLKQETANLGVLGTALKKTTSMGDSAIVLSSATQLRDHLTSQMFAKTKDNLAVLLPAAKAVGVKVNELGTEEQQKKVVQRLVDLVVTRIGQGTGQFQNDVLQEWIRSQRESGQNWSAVRGEGIALIEQLYQDPKTRAMVQANMESVLVDPKLLRGQMQSKLDKWQIPLDAQLKEIMRFDVGDPPQSAVQAAEQRVQYLQGALSRFQGENGEGGLVAWMGGEGTENPRTKLLKELGNLEKDQVQALINLDITHFDEKIANLTTMTAESDYQDALISVNSAEDRVKIAELNVTIGTWQEKAQHLASKRTEIEANAQDASAQAAAQRALSARSQIQATRENLNSSVAHLEGAKRFGAEASRVGTMLSQPPLRGLDLPKTALAVARRRYADQLEVALHHFREFQRMLQSIGVQKGLAFNPPDQPTTNVADTWGRLLQAWKDAASSRTPGAELATINWDLTPHQVAALFSPGGLRLVIAPNIDEEPEIFRLPDPNGYWREELNSAALGKPIFEVFDDAPALDHLRDGNWSEAWNNKFVTNGIIFQQADMVVIEQYHANSIDGSWWVTCQLSGQRYYIEQIGARLDVFVYSLWHDAARRAGLHLSHQLKVTTLSSSRWEILDNRRSKVKIRHDNVEMWEIDGEPKRYLVEFRDDQLIVRHGYESVSPLRGPQMKVRSALDNQIARNLNNAAMLNTGRLLALSLSARDNQYQWFQSEDRYSLEVEHLGDVWHTLNGKEPVLWRARGLPENRDLWTAEEQDLKQVFGQNGNLLILEGDQNPNVELGTPLSGTTIIRLRSVSSVQPPFPLEGTPVQLRILCKYYG